MEQLHNVIFWIETDACIEDTALGSETGKLRAFFQEVCDLLMELGFTVEKNRAIRGTDCLYLEVIGFWGNVKGAAIPDLEDIFQKGKCFKYLGFHDFGTGYVLSPGEMERYFWEHLEKYEHDVMGVLRKRHAQQGDIWVREPIGKLDSDVLICQDFQVKLLYQNQFHRVAEEMQKEGKLLVKEWEGQRLYSLPELQI